MAHASTNVRSSLFGIAIAGVVASFGCGSGEGASNDSLELGLEAEGSRGGKAGGFTIHATISADPNSQPISPNTLVEVDSRDGTQKVKGDIGRTPEQRSLAWDPVSRFLFGVESTGVGPVYGGVVARIDPATGEATVLVRYTEQTINSIAFSPGGQMYAVVHPRTLAVVDLSSGGLDEIGQIPGGLWIHSIEFATDGTLFALLLDFTPDLVQTILTVDPETAAVTSSLTLQPEYALGDIAVAPDGSIYATNYSWWLIRVDPSSGEQVPVGLGDQGALSGLAVEY